MQEQKNTLQCNTGVHEVSLISESGGGAADHLRIFEKSLPGIAAIGAIFKGSDSAKSVVAIIPMEEIPNLIKFLDESYNKYKQEQ